MSTTQSTDPKTPLQKILRDRGHGSVTALADELGMSREHLSAISSGRVKPSYRLRQRIAEAVGAEADELW